MSFIPWQVWAGAGALVLASLFWWWLTRTLKKQGELQALLGAAEKGNEDARKAIEIAEANRRLPDDELRRKL